MQLCWLSQVCAGVDPGAGQAPDDSASTAEGVLISKAEHSRGSRPALDSLSGAVHQ